MAEKQIRFDTVNPLELFGVNNKYLDIMRDMFPKLKVVFRGNIMKIIGEDDEVKLFEDKLRDLVDYYEAYGSIDSSIVKKIFDDIDFKLNEKSTYNKDVLVHGVGGIQVKAVTVNQKKMVELTNTNDLIFAIGPAGTGKTYTAVALAVRALKNKQVKRIILTRPAVEAGESLGFLPGDMKEKLDPYLRPLYDALRDMIPHAKLNSYLETGTIEIAPLAYMRGRTLDHAFAILDEAQNATEQQLKMFLTRMGKSAKFIVTGDITQVDLPKNRTSGLKHATRILGNINGISFIFLDDRDIIRHKLVTKIVDAYEKNKS